MRCAYLCLPLLCLAGLPPTARAADAPDAVQKKAALPAPAAANRAATREELDLLTDALTKVAREMERWAYTETTLVKDDKGRVKEDRVVRHDPSKPYAEQDVPLRIAGKTPTESQLKDYRKRGEKRAERAEKPDGFNLLPSRPDRPKQTVGDLVDLDRATIVADDGERLTYELPLRKFGNVRFPPENFQVLVRIARAGHVLEHAEAKLRDSFRYKLIVKIASGEASADFAMVDPKFGPAMTAVRGTGSVSILFFRFGATGEMRHTDVKHVKPYREQFEVQIGPLKALDF